MLLGLAGSRDAGRRWEFSERVCLNQLRKDPELEQETRHPEPPRERALPFTEVTGGREGLEGSINYIY